jgi:hypothetical protein
MALRASASFDYSTSGTLTEWLFGTSSGNSMATGTGRNGTTAFTVVRGNAWVERVLDAQATWIVGVAVNTRTNNGTNGIIALLDGAVVHGVLVIDASGILKYYRGNETTLLATGTTTLAGSVFNYIELKVLISDTVGTIDIKVNGVTETLTFASGSNGSQDTRNAGNATADRIRIGGMNTNNTIARDFDDVYVCDGTGSSPTNTFLGDVRVQYIPPNGNGNTSNLVGNDGNSTDNYLLVDETGSPNGDTDYVESSTVGDKDTYAMTNVTPATGTVYGVRPILYARKTDAGTRKIASVVRLSSTEVDSADNTLTTSYAYFVDTRETKPGGGSWSITDVNAMELGVKVTA